MRSTLPPLALVALLLLPVAARAGLPGYQVVTKHGPATVYTTPNKATVIYGNTSGITTAQQESLARAYGLAMPGNVAGGVSVADTVKVAIGGAVIDAVATRVVPASAYPAIAVAGAFAGGYVVGTALYDYFTDNGVSYDPDTRQFFTTSGATTPTNERWVATNPSIPIPAFGTKSAACSAAAAYYNAQAMKSSLAASATTLSAAVSESSATSFKCVTSRRITWNNGWLPDTVSEDIWFTNYPTGGSCVDANGVLSPTVGGQCSPGVRNNHNPGDVPPLLQKPPANPPGLVGEGVDKGADVPAGNPQLSGPSSGPGRGSSTGSSSSSGPGGAPGGSSSSATNVTNNYHYDGDTVTVTQTVTNNTTNSDGSTTESQQEKEPDPLCGVAGYPACAVKVDEQGTPEWKQPGTKELDDIKAADAVKLNEVAQSIPEPDLGWFGAPPIAACHAFVFPHDIGEVNPCGVVGAVRSVMAYLWAIVAAWMAFGWIRQAVNGG